MATIWKPEIGRALPTPTPVGEVDVTLNPPKVGTPVVATHKDGSIIKGYYDGNLPEHTNIFSIRLGKENYSEVISIWTDAWKIELEDQN